jgi:ANTAR domain
MEAAAVLPQGWARLVALLDGHPDADPMSRARRLCELGVETAGVTGATLGIGGENRSTICATDEVSERLEDLQLTYSEGPAVDAVRDGVAVLVPDLSDASDASDASGVRWPWYTPAALEAGARAVFVFPVQVGAIRLGSLAFYRASTGVLGPEQAKDARTLADAAAVLLSVGTGPDTAEAFVWAMDDHSRFRAEVHQAVGATMVELGVDAKQAFALLRAHAFATGRPIAEVAADIMAKRLRLEPD